MNNYLIPWSLERIVTIICFPSRFVAKLLSELIIRQYLFVRNYKIGLFQGHHLKCKFEFEKNFYCTLSSLYAYTEGWRSKEMKAKQTLAIANVVLAINPHKCRTNII